MDPINITTILTTSFTELQAGIMSAISTVAPIAITVMAAMLSFRYGKKLFSMLSK